MYRLFRLITIPKHKQCGCTYMRTARCKHIYLINGLNGFFFSLFACSEINCPYLFIYSAVKWNQHHILVMIESSNRDEGGLGIRHGQ